MALVPFYGFTCGACGPFDVQRPMAAAGEPADCPGCGTPAARVFSAPASTVRSPGAVADAVDERSRHAPERVTRAVGGDGHGGHGHGHSHDHGGSRSSRGRPWQISH
jgi:putative FmdB family regulatory protein